MSVALVIVSHSAALAQGVVELASQMAPGVSLRAVGGTEEGDLGTSAPRIEAALREVLASGEDAVVLLDLGSAAMNAALALELLEEPLRARVAVADAPLVEGAVLAAVEAEGGAGLAQVQAEAEGARAMKKRLE